jgi:hypothetical protein
MNSFLMRYAEVGKSRHNVEWNACSNQPSPKIPSNVWGVFQLIMFWIFMDQWQPHYQKLCALGIPLEAAQNYILLALPWVCVPWILVGQSIDAGYALLCSCYIPVHHQRKPIQIFWGMGRK